jgi:hypothetical protein
MAVLRDFSLILLAIEAFVMALFPLFLLGGLTYGLWWLRRRENLPSWLKLAQAYLSLASSYVELAMAVVIKPVLFVHSILATVQRWSGIVTKKPNE